MAGTGRYKGEKVKQTSNFHDRHNMVFTVSCVNASDEVMRQMRQELPVSTRL